MDEIVIRALHQFTSPPWMDSFMVFMSWLGDNGMVWCVLAAILLAWPKKRRAGLICASALLMSLLFTNTILKNLVARPRPYEVFTWLAPLVPALSDFSFPSGHASASFAAATAVILSGLDKKWVIPSLVLAILISFSRIYVGMHYPTDVLAGAFIGALCGVLSWLLWKTVFNARK